MILLHRKVLTNRARLRRIDADVTAALRQHGCCELTIINMGSGKVISDVFTVDQYRKSSTPVRSLAIPGMYEIIVTKP